VGRSGEVKSSRPGRCFVPEDGRVQAKRHWPEEGGEVHSDEVAPRSWSSCDVFKTRDGIRRVRSPRPFPGTGSWRSGGRGAREVSGHGGGPNARLYRQWPPPTRREERDKRGTRLKKRPRGQAGSSSRLDRLNFTEDENTRNVNPRRCTN